MANQDLVNYIWGYLQQGYDAAAIEASLINQGYDKRQVDAAFKTVYASSYYSQLQKSQPVNHSKGYSSSQITAIIVAIIGVSIIVLLGFVMMGDPTQSPTPLPIDAPPVQPRPIEATPTTPPPQPTPSDNQQPTQPSTNERSLDIPSQFEAGSRLSRIEIQERITQLAPNNPQEAIRYCPQIATRHGENDCYIQVAELSAQSSYCRLIDNEQQHDLCLMKFAIAGNGNEQICNQITNPYRRETCIQLLSFEQITQDFVIEHTPPSVPTFTDDRFSGGAYVLPDNETLPSIDPDAPIITDEIVSSPSNITSQPINQTEIASDNSTNSSDLAVNTLIHYTTNIPSIF